MFEIGNSLREARLRQALDFPEIEQATKIRGRYLRALEDEQFDLLPAQTYVKGFLRTYAEYLGLDGQLYVDEYNSRYVTGEEVEPPLRRSSVGPRRHRRLESRVVLLTLVAIAIVTALVIAAWTSGGEDRQTLPNLPSGKTKTAPKTAVHKKKPAKPKSKLARLTVTATRGSCWMEVHRGAATGPQIFAGTVDPGESQRFVAKLLWINIGAPENLDAKLNGKRVSLGAGPGVLLVNRKGVHPASTG